MRRVKHKLATEMRRLRGQNASTVLAAINPIVRRWASYYRAVVSKKTFTDVDDHVRDRADQFTASFDAVGGRRGYPSHEDPGTLSRAKCFAERFVFTARTELTNRMLIFGERHLRTMLTTYSRHYNGRRPHRDRQLRPPQPDHPVPILNDERITRRPILGGLINEYEQAA